MTQEFLQDAIVEDLKQLFSHYTLTNSLGVERAVKIVPQGLPIREGDDEETDAEAPPEPYVAVKLSDGEVTAQDARCRSSKQQQFSYSPGGGARKYRTCATVRHADRPL